LWGSPRDIAFVEYLLSVECLGDVAGDPEDGKRWIKGEGFKPWYQIAYDQKPDSYGQPKPIPGRLSNPFIRTVDRSLQMFSLTDDSITLDERLSSLTCRGHPKSSDRKLVCASKKGFHRSPAKTLYEPPLVLVNDGFNRFSFVDFFAFYQHSLTGISGPDSDENLLRFLSVSLNSKLSKFFIFHISSSLGTERERVLVQELLRLPFPLPDSPNSHKDAEAIVQEVAARMKALQTEFAMEYTKAESAGDFELRTTTLAESRRARVEQLQAELEPLVYKYFKLNKYEIMHIEDTCETISPSTTPTSPTIQTKTTDPISPTERMRYADLLCKTLNRWSKSDQSGDDSPPFYFAAELENFADIGMVLVTLNQADSPTSPIEVAANRQLQKAVNRITKSSSYEQGSFSYLRGKIFASGKKKPHP
jgi:hypothetical protein